MPENLPLDLMAKDLSLYLLHLEQERYLVTITVGAKVVAAEGTIYM